MLLCHALDAPPTPESIALLHELVRRLYDGDPGPIDAGVFHYSSGGYLRCH